jgi:protein-S-isoprenylcysteine O-methyltransferase Ste14
MKDPKILPPAYLLIAMISMVVLHFVLPIVRLIPAPWNVLGIVFLLAGITLELLADSLFHRVGTTVKPHEEPSTLVTRSVFRISRNPMYLGFAFLLAGIALLLGTLTPFLVIPLFMILIDRLFISIEEKMLEVKFGRTWMTYKQKVRRWI